MHLILEEEPIAEFVEEEVPGVGVADVHGLLEDVPEAAGEHDPSALLLPAGEGFLEGLDVGQPAAVVPAAQTDRHAHADGVVITLAAVGVAEVVSEVGLVYLDGDGLVLLYDLEGHALEYLLDVLLQPPDSWFSD